MDREITIHSRSLSVPVFGSPDFSESFVPSLTVWAIVQSVDGKTMFDGVNQVDRAVTHTFTLRHDPLITAESWVEYNGVLYDILRVDDLDGRGEFMVLTASERGANSLPAARL